MGIENNSFLDWLVQWEVGLPSLDLETIVSKPARVALVSEDLVKGFCSVGPLSSPRVAGIVPEAVGLFRRTRDLGVEHFLLFQDTHEPDAIEFSAYPPHSVVGTAESETIDELSSLPFLNQFTIFPKNTISSNLGTDFDAWLEAHPQVTTFIVVGDCTDICIYQAAMHLRMRANVLGQGDVRVIVPADCVQTYDLPVETALGLGALPHDGDLVHRVFLYHLALNGVEVVARLD